MPRGKLEGQLRNAPINPRRLFCGVEPLNCWTVEVARRRSLMPGPKLASSIS
jgi:hypothetical protein